MDIFGGFCIDMRKFAETKAPRGEVSVYGKTKKDLA